MITERTVPLQAFYSAGCVLSNGQRQPCAGHGCQEACAQVVANMKLADMTLVVDSLSLLRSRRLCPLIHLTEACRRPPFSLALGHHSRASLCCLPPGRRPGGEPGVRAPPLLGDLLSDSSFPHVLPHASIMKTRVGFRVLRSGEGRKAACNPFFFFFPPLLPFLLPLEGTTSGNARGRCRCVCLWRRFTLVSGPSHALA